MPELGVVFVHAHPDDESSKGAGTMARYAKEGYRVTLVTLTDGAAGDILNPAMDRPGIKERMPEVRREELARALEILGVTDAVQLGYPDSGYVEGFEGDASVLAPDAFYNVDHDEAVGRLVAVLRDRRPDVLVTYPPDGGYPHPDHLRCHTVSVAAYEAAGDLSAFPEAGPPHRVRKLYWMTSFNATQVRALHTAALDRGLESPFTRWLEFRDLDTEVDPSTTRVDVGDYLAARKQALLAHATQIDPDGMWFSIPEEVVRDVHPTEDYQLARSDVSADVPEDSLFAGLEA